MDNKCKFYAGCVYKGSDACDGCEYEIKKEKDERNINKFGLNGIDSFRDCP